MKFKKILILLITLPIIVFIAGCKNKKEDIKNILEPSMRINSQYEHSTTRSRITGPRGIAPRENDKVYDLAKYRTLRFYFPISDDIKDKLKDVIEVKYNNVVVPLALNDENKLEIPGTSLYLDFKDALKNSEETKKNMKNKGITDSLDFRASFDIKFFEKKGAINSIFAKTLETKLGFASEEYLKRMVYDNPDANMNDKNRLNKLYIEINKENENKPKVSFNCDDDLLLSTNATLRSTTTTLEDDLLKLISIKDNSESLTEFKDIKQAYTDKRLVITNLKKIKPEEMHTTQEVKYRYTSKFSSEREKTFKINVQFSNETHAPVLAFNDKVKIEDSKITYELPVTSDIETAVKNFFNSLKFIDFYDGIIPLTGENDLLVKAKQIIDYKKIVFEGNKPKTYQMNNIKLVGSDPLKPLEFSINLTIKDTLAPVISKIENIYTQPNKSVDYTKIIKFKDNIDNFDVKLTFNEINKVDFSKTGEYSVEVYATDKSGNKSQAKVFKVCVTKKVSVIPLVAIVNASAIVLGGVGVGIVVFLYKRNKKIKLQSEEEFKNA